ncbi:hypothetical protein QTO34_018099 [Cnephaeus nilssonii]|uniref:Uncharacterized protein n=1 Tax=Cnephaeus nilssonii TaxID=3371016 RepID=A0AA40LCR8_CNENI|nr:hypothetical protein QTO34_018099 [Eptesicus nilssonii]
MATRRRVLQLQSMSRLSAFPCCPEASGGWGGVEHLRHRRGDDASIPPCPWPLSACICKLTSIFVGLICIRTPDWLVGIAKISTTCTIHIPCPLVRVLVVILDIWTKMLGVSCLCVVSVTLSAVSMMTSTAVLGVVSGDGEAALHRVGIVCGITITITSVGNPLQPLPWSLADPVHVVAAKGESRGCTGESQRPPRLNQASPRLHQLHLTLDTCKYRDTGGLRITWKHKQAQAQGSALPTPENDLEK